MTGRCSGHVSLGYPLRGARSTGISPQFPGRSPRPASLPRTGGRGPDARRDVERFALCDHVDAPQDANPPVPREADASAEEAPTIAAEDLPDIESLDKDSDYTPFMQEGVPDELKNLALRALWRSDPVLANLDGLNDYEENFKVAGLP